MPKDDLNPRGQIIIPASWRIVGPDAQTPGSVDVIAASADTINSFVFAARQRVNTSSIDIHKATFTSPDIDIAYHNQFGSERIELTPYVRRPVVEVEPDEPINVPVPETPFIPFHERPVLCLVVLYKKNKIALFDMASLGANPQTMKAGAVLISSGTLQNKDADFGTDNILVNQINGVILGGADLTGKSDGTKLCICTTLISDTVATSVKLMSDGQDTAAMPILPLMNVGKSTTPPPIIAYTIAGAYTITSKDITLTTPAMPPSPGTPSNTAPPAPQPCALDVDGTSYFYGGANGPASLMVVDIATVLNDSSTKQLADYVSSLAEMEQPTVAAYYLYLSSYSKQITNQLNVVQVGEYSYIGSGQGGYVNFTYESTDGLIQDVTYTFVTGGIANGAKENVSETVGVAMLAQVPFGQSPSLTKMTVAISPKPYMAFDPALNATSSVLGTKTLSDYSGKLARSVFLPATGLKVVLDDITATGSITTTIAATPGPAPSLGPLQQYDVFGALIGSTTTTPYPQILVANGSSNPSAPPLMMDGGTATETTGTSCFAQFGGVTSAAITNIENNDIATADTLRNAMNTLMLVPGQIFNTSLASPNVEVVEYAHAGAIGDTVTTTVLQPYPGLPPEPDFRPDMPTQATVNSTLTTNATLSWNGVMIASNSTSTLSSALSTTPTILPGGMTTTIRFHPFPPSLDESLKTKATCYYEMNTVTDAQDETKTTTPYDTYTDVLTPWLHVSNTQHYIQGYAIGTTPKLTNYLYLDGVDFMTFLTKTLDCEANDVVACYMDIPLPVAQGIAKVTSSRKASTGM